MLTAIWPVLLRSGSFLQGNTPWVWVSLLWGSYVFFEVVALSNADNAAILSHIGFSNASWWYVYTGTNKKHVRGQRALNPCGLKDDCV